MIVGIFELHNTIGVTMVNQVKVFFLFIYLFDKIVAYVKDDGSNLFTLIITLTSVISCSSLQLPCPFVRSCFDHVMSKTCQHAIDDAKVCHGFVKVSLKSCSNFISKEYNMDMCKHGKLDKKIIHFICILCFAYENNKVT